MEENLKRDWNEIVSLHINDKNFYLRICKAVKTSIDKASIDVFNTSQEELFLYKRIWMWYTKVEKEELLEKLKRLNPMIS